MLMKYRDFKVMSKTDMKSIMGGYVAVSDCSMKCIGGEKIEITGCDGACGCSETAQGCVCMKNGGVECEKLCTKN